MPSDSSTPTLDEIGQRREVVQASGQRNYLSTYEREIGNLDIAVTDILMILAPERVELANVFAEFWPDVAIHVLGSGKELAPEVIASLLPNVRYVHAPSVGTRRDYVQDRLVSRPQVIIEHGTNKSGEKRFCFRTLFWSLPPGGIYAVEALETTHDPDLDDGKPAPNVLQMLVSAANGGTLSRADRDELPVFDGELARIPRVDFHGTLAIAHKSGSHLFKLREWEDHARYEERWGSSWGELLHTEPAYDYRPRATLQTYGDGPIQEERPVIEVPERHLRRQLDVECRPRRLLTREGYVLAESFRHPHQGRLSHPQMINTTPNLARHRRRYRERHADGEFFFFDTAFPGHFGHVTTEQLSHMWGWERALEMNPDVRPIVSLYASMDQLHEYQYQLFAGLGISRESIELVQNNEAVHVDSLITSTPAFENPQYVDLDMTRVWHNLLHGLPADERTGRPEKIFISRKVGTKRGATNSPAIEAVFEKYGFTIVYPEDLAYVEQAHTFAAAKVIGGFGGSGMFNMMFNPAAKIIMVSGDSYTAQNEYLFAAANGNEIHYFWGDSHLKSADGRFDREAFKSDFDFDIRRNRKDLKAVLS